jgi:mono/diheme cytochrome c family protein
MRQMRNGRGAGIALMVVACAVALGTPVALAHRTTHKAVTPVGDIANGYKVFNEYFCVACHSMKAAGPAAYGQLGMNFNTIKAPYAVSIAAVTKGLPAALPLYPTQMVGFGAVLTPTQIQDVSAFLAKYSGGYKTCTECPTTTTTSG